MSAETSEIQDLGRSARQEIAAAQSPQALTEARARYLGRKGSVSALLRTLGGLDPA